MNVATFSICFLTMVLQFVRTCEIRYDTRMYNFVVYNGGGSA